jgi:nicotinate-nucleotide adenylyltransferase
MNQMSGKLYFGGSFDPIHFGHLRCSKAVAETVGFTRVVLIPSWRSPLKTGPLASTATPADRLEMCKLAATEDPIFAVNDLEIARRGFSYTIDTVRTIRNGGETVVNWLIGADQLALLPHWHKPQDLVREANLIVMGRLGFDFMFDNLPDWLQPLRQNVVEIPLMQVSSTEIRQRVRDGKSFGDLVPAGVERYITEHGLYRTEA